jgi:3-oxoacyl-[acyl-carrier protein] reductase
MRRAVAEQEDDGMNELSGRVALVTGASGGIGAAVARSLAEQGVRLGLASRSGGDLGIDGSIAAPCDVRDPAAVRAFVEQIVARFGRLDIVIANAGVGAYGPFLELDPGNLEEMLDTNVKGTIYTIRAALPHLLESDRADIVTVASEAGRRGLPFEAVYSASKFAQVGFTRALDHELRPQGVRCTNVCPGGVATGFAMGRGRTPDMPELAGMMSADDVAEAVLFVLTRPRNHRILEMAFRPMTEGSWG